MIDKAFDLVLGWLTPYLWFIVAAGYATLGAAYGYEKWQRHSAEAKTARCIDDRNLDKAHATTAALVQTAQYRATEQAWRNKQKEIADEADKQLAHVRADAAIADAAAGRLSQRVAALVAAARATAANPAAVSASAPADTAADLLAGMLGRVDEAAGQLAAYADNARAAGAACQAEYDALTR